MAKKASTQILNDQIKILKNDESTPEQVNEAVKLITTTTANSVKGNLAKDILLVQHAVAARDNTLLAVAGHNKDNRLVTRLQELFRDIAVDDDPTGKDKVVQKKLLKFDNLRQDQRFRANTALRSMSGLIIQLQETIVHTFEKDKKGAAVGFTKKLTTSQIFKKYTEAVADLGGTIDKKDVAKYLMMGDDAALTRIATQVKGLEKEKEIIDNLVVGRGRLQGLKVYGNVKISDLGVILMKAAMATEAVIPDYKEHWFTALQKNPAHRGAMIDLNLDDGSGFLIYLPKNMKDPPELLYGNTAKYHGIANPDKVIENQNKLDLLKYLENPKEASRPTASLVFAHVYEEDEIVLAFNKMPNGSEIKVNVLTDQSTTEPATLIKKSDKMEYKTSPSKGSTWPDINELNAKPCRWMDAATLNFILNKTTQTAILND